MKAFHSSYRARGILVAGFPSRPSFASFAVKGYSVDSTWVDAEFVGRKQTPRPWL
jgi:hypothetical protein